MANGNFGSVDEAIKAVKATVDDVDSVTVCFTKTLTSDNVEDGSDVGMVLNYCSGEHGLLSRALAVCLLNDGILARLRIPIQFL